MEKKDTKLCKKCKEEINSKAKKCPHCGAKQGIHVWLIVIIVIFVLAIFSNNSNSTNNNSDNSTNNSSNNSDNQSNSNKKSNEKLSLLESYKSNESNEFAYYIEGKIKNNKNRDFSYVQVIFITYDSEGNTIGSCLDNNSGLSANGTWKFKAICTEGIDKIDHYELKEITGY